MKTSSCYQTVEHPSPVFKIFSRKSILRWLPCLVGLGFAAGASGQQFNAYTGVPEYRNRLYIPAPLPVSGVTVSQAESVALYSGHIETFNGAPNNAASGQPATAYLVRSSFGQAVAVPVASDFDFGEEIVPDDDIRLLVDLTVPPDIVPPEKAVYVTDVVANLYKVFAADPGFVDISWKNSAGNVVATKNYLIGSRPVRVPVALYHTHQPGVADFSVNPLPVPQTEAPLVNVSGVPSTQFHWNSLVPSNPANPYVVKNPSGELYARDRTGLILLEYRSNGTFLGMEIVAVRSHSRPDAVSHWNIGSRLLPSDIVNGMDAPIVMSGMDPSNPNPAVDLIHQHVFPGSAQHGELYAINRNYVAEDMEVFWMRRGLENVLWPYELHRYSSDWPSDEADYQIYVRGPAPDLGPDVDLPAALQAELMPFQEPPGHANAIVADRFSTSEAGFCLLKYQPGDAIGFQVVRSVMHHDTQFFDLTPEKWIVGTDITDAYHEASHPGYLHLPDGMAYDWETYDGKPGDPGAFRTGQITAVNEGALEVWWYNLNQGVAWPSLVKAYYSDWPANPEKIIIASQEGTGPIDPVVQSDTTFYYQNDPSLPGFNPNDEHAMMVDGKIFALRNDLGTPATSDPYVIMKYRDPADNFLWKYRIFEVVAEEAPYFFQYDATAGDPIQGPLPISAFPQVCPETTGVSGPYWEDRKGAYWARAAGDNGGTADIVMQFFYPVQQSFFFPDANPPSVGDHVPWLDVYALTPGTPVDVTFQVSWPTNTPVLRVGETLVQSKFGLPDINGQTSVEIIYQQSQAQGGGESVKLIDPTRSWEVDLAQLPGDVATARDGADIYFPDVPPHLRGRFVYDEINAKLRFWGEFKETPAGLEEPRGYLLLNVMTDRERDVLLNLSGDPAYRTAVNTLSSMAANAVEVTPGETNVSSFAVTAGLAEGTGYVTLTFGNSTTLTPSADPVSLEVFQVSCPIYRGELNAILSDNPFDEKLTLRHTGDYAGRAGDYIFEWKTLPPEDGDRPTAPPALWNTYTPSPASGQGALDITIQGASLFTLSDNYFICRYRPRQTVLCSDPANPQGWSAWTEPQLAEGWIKRVLNAINPFEQRIQSYQNNTVNTVVSMISQAGTRWIGSIPLNAAAANNFGLIEIYETVLNRGMSLSIDGAPPIDYGPANDALLLAASRIAELYTLLGNEAYADASDPTIGFGTDDGVYGSEATSIHCFMNQTASLLEEELNLLRGRDDSLQPNVRTFPFYNRLIWNFTRGIT
jgi:hypothetical protein